MFIYHHPFFDTLNFCQCNSFSLISSNSVRYPHFLFNEKTIMRPREPSMKHSFNKQLHYAYFTFCASMQSMYFCIASSLPIPFKAFQAFHFAFSVRAKIPGDGMLQSPIVACLNNEYPASLSSFDTVLAGCQERTNSATSLNLFSKCKSGKCS